MLTVAQQLAAAAEHAARLRAVALAAAKVRDEEARRRRLAAQSGWATRQDAGKFAATGLIGAVLDALPTRREEALSLGEVERRVADIRHAPSGVSATLSSLIRQGYAERLGEVRHYRYFRL